MRSTSAFVKPATAATAITAKIAIAVSSPAPSARSAYHATGSPSMSRNAVGEPGSQYQYGRRSAIPYRYTASVARSVPIGSYPVAAATATWTASSTAPHSRPSASMSRNPERRQARIAAQAPTASSDQAKNVPSASSAAPASRAPARREQSGQAASIPTVAYTASADVAPKSRIDGRERGEQSRDPRPVLRQHGPRRRVRQRRDERAGHDAQRRELARRCRSPSSA